MITSALEKKKRADKEEAHRLQKWEHGTNSDQLIFVHVHFEKTLYLHYHIEKKR